MSLSNETIDKLASSLLPEGLIYVEFNERYYNKLIEFFCEFIGEQMGPMCLDLKYEIAICMANKVTLTVAPYPTVLNS